MTNAIEAATIRYLTAQIGAFERALIDRATMGDIYLGPGEYGAITMRESLDALCEDYGWQWESESRLMPTRIVITPTAKLPV